MLSDISDSTDFSDDDDDGDDGEESVTPIVKSSTSSRHRSRADALTSRKKDARYPSYSLDAPRTTTYSAEALYNQIGNGFIILNPDYQRNIVWTDKKQSDLIDSMIRNYYIPPIVFTVGKDRRDNVIKTCIDGKQRLTSLKKFMDGLIPCIDPRTNQKWWYKSSKASNKVLPANIRQQLRDKQISCVEFTKLSDDDEREIFQRVQLGVVLTPAERMQAIKGPWPTLIRKILKSHFSLLPSQEQNGSLNPSKLVRKQKLEDLRHLIEWCTNRGRGFQVVANIIYFIENESSSLENVPNYPLGPAFNKWLTRNTTPSRHLIKKVNETCTIIILIARDVSLFKVFSGSHRISPAEFIMAGVLISRRMGGWTLDMLAKGIAKMRSDVRKHHQDIRYNRKVIRHMFGFIYETLPKDPELNKKSSNNKSRTAVEIARSVEIGAVLSSAISSLEKRKNSGQAGRKRKKEDIGDSSEDEDENDKDDSSSEAQSEAVPEVESPRPAKRSRLRKTTSVASLRVSKRIADKPRLSLDRRSTRRNPLPTADPIIRSSETPSQTDHPDALSLRNVSQVTDINSKIDALREGTAINVVGQGSSNHQPIDSSQQSDDDDDDSDDEDEDANTNVPSDIELARKQSEYNSMHDGEYPDHTIGTLDTITTASSVDPGRLSKQFVDLEAAETGAFSGPTNDALTDNVDTTSTAMNSSLAQPFTLQAQILDLANNDADRLLQMILNGVLRIQPQEPAQTAQTHPTVLPHEVFPPRTSPALSESQGRPIQSQDGHHISQELQTALVQMMQPRAMTVGMSYPTQPLADPTYQGTVILPNAVLSSFQNTTAREANLSQSDDSDLSRANTDAGAGPISKNQLIQPNLAPSHTSSRSASAMLHSPLQIGSQQLQDDSSQLTESHVQEDRSLSSSSSEKSVHWSGVDDHADNSQLEPQNFVPRPRPARRYGGKIHYTDRENYNNGNLKRFADGDDLSRLANQPNFIARNNLIEDGVIFVRKATSINTGSEKEAIN